MRPQSLIKTIILFLISLYLVSNAYAGKKENYLKSVKKYLVKITQKSNLSSFQHEKKYVVLHFSKSNCGGCLNVWNPLKASVQNNSDKFILKVVNISPSWKEFKLAQRHGANGTPFSIIILPKSKTQGFNDSAKAILADRTSLLFWFINQGGFEVEPI